MDLSTSTRKQNPDPIIDINLNNTSPLLRIPSGVMPRPMSAPLPVEDLQHMTEEIQSSLSYASRLCFSDGDEEESKEARIISLEDVQLLYAKIEGISSNWQQLMQSSEAFRKLPMSDSIDEEPSVVKADGKKLQHHVVAYRPGRPPTRDERLNLESRGDKPRSDSFEAGETAEGISLGSVLYPRYKTSNVIHRVVSTVLQYIGSEAHEIMHNVHVQDYDNKSVSDFSVGSRGSPTKGAPGGMSLDGVGSSVRSIASSPVSRIRRNRSPSGRRLGQQPRQQKTSPKPKDRVLFARKAKQFISMTDEDDDHAMTIFSATGIDKGTNTDNVSGIKMADIEKAGSLENPSADENTIISQISFPESIPPKSKYVLDPTYAHFPELGVPSSPYAVRKKSTPDPRIVKELKESLNPLVTLYNEYWQYIPSVFRAKLLSTSATKNEYVSSRDSLNLLFDAVYKEIEKLELSLNVSSKGLDHSTKLTQSLIIAGEHKKLSEPYRKALSQLLINIAEIEVSAVWADIQLTEYRDMFHKFHHMGIPNLSQMIKMCTSYRLSQQKFVACESISRGLLDRVMHIKSQWGNTLRVPPEQLFISEADVQMRLNGYVDVINRLKFENREVQGELLSTRNQLQNACQEIMDSKMEMDRTPSAFLFYVTLLDPAILPSLHTIIDEMRLFKQFVSGEMHFEYTAVRRGLEACTTVLPYVERFLSRFNDLKKKWIKDRVGKFTVMGLAGGDADATSVCPFCDSDTRMFDKK